MILHEIFGLSPDDIAFASRLAKRGFTVYAPVLFGIPNHPTGPLYSLVQAVHVCVSREFAIFAKRRSSPITVFLRALGRQIFTQHGGRGIAVIGLCLTGGFALAMMADEHLVAPVLSEPALPFGITPASRRSLHITDDELACVKRRAVEGVTYLGFRFKGDCISPVARFDRLEGELGKESFERYDLEPTVPGSHAVFTDDYARNAATTFPAFERLVQYLLECL
jgi:dienelactone hydrolase